MDDRKDLRYIYGWNYYTMKFAGIWPDEREWNKPSSYLALIPILTMLCFICAPQTINLSFIWGDFHMVIENLSLGNITITISLLKTIAFWINGKSLKSLLTCMANDWESLTNEKDRRIMLELADRIRNIIRRSTIMCHTIVYVYVILRFATQKYSHTKLLFRGYFPYNIDVSPNYELTVIGQLIAALYAATTYTAVDTFISMLILHVCGQLTILRDELQNIQKYEQTDLHAMLTNFVKKHDYLNRFAETIERCFNMMFLMQMLGATVQLCFQSLQAFMPFDQAKEIVILQDLFLVLYVVYVMLQLYLYCYVGEKLSVESTGLANAAYNSKWYDLAPKNARLLILVMCRARVPLRITAGRFCFFTIMLYSQVLRTSLGYISVLYAMKDK